MRPLDKQPRTSITFTPLTGGINTSEAPHLIANGDLADCQNLLYEEATGKLTGRAGLALRSSFPSAIQALHYDIDTNTVFVFLANRSVYHLTDSDNPTLIGTLSGSHIPTCVKFQNRLYIASGDRLQSYDYSASLTTIDTAPPADLVFVRSGRLCTALTGSDRIRYSAIGDATDWTSSATDASGAGWLDIGYGDSGDISAIVPLANDLIIFKTNGRIYQLNADSTPASWRVTELATSLNLRGNRCATHLKGNIVYLTDRGLVSLAATADYGNLAATDIGDKFAALLADTDSTARFYPLTRRGLLIISPHRTATCLIAYHAALSAATCLQFPFAIADICETSDYPLIAAGRNLYTWTPDAHTDNNTPIDYRLTLRHLQDLRPLHLSAVYTDLTADTPTTAHLTTSDTRRTLTANLSTNARTYLRTNHTAHRIAITLQANKPFTINDITARISPL